MRLNVNHASISQLAALPGVGRDLAQGIVEYRSSYGCFQDLDELRRVPYVDAPSFAALSENVEVQPTTCRGKGKWCLDLNHATIAELRLLPGLGPTLAHALVEHRKARGPFANVEDLRRVSGFDMTTIRRIAPYVRV